jgi:hypothetical protein
MVDPACGAYRAQIVAAIYETVQQRDDALILRHGWIDHVTQSRSGGWTGDQPFNRSQLSGWLGRPMLW